MNSRIFLFITLMAVSPLLFAQKVLIHIVEYQGMTYGDGSMEEVEIDARKPSEKEMRNAQKKIEKYDKLRFHVHKVYPYAAGVAKLCKDIEVETAKMPNESARKDYLEKKQKELFKKYQDDIVKMSHFQGKILIKLIHRQTGNSLYSLIKDVKNSVTAFFYHGIGTVWGYNTKDDFDSTEDQLIEIFARELDNGGYNIFYQKDNFTIN